MKNFIILMFLGLMSITYSNSASARWWGNSTYRKFKAEFNRSAQLCPHDMSIICEDTVISKLGKEVLRFKGSCMYLNGDKAYDLYVNYHPYYADPDYPNYKFAAMRWDYTQEAVERPSKYSSDRDYIMSADTSRGNGTWRTTGDAKFDLYQEKMWWTEARMRGTPSRIALKMIPKSGAADYSYCVLDRIKD